MEGDIEKCREHRSRIIELDFIPEAVWQSLSSSNFKSLSSEADFIFDTDEHDLRGVLAQVLDIADAGCLHQLHELKGRPDVKGGNFKSDKFPLLKNLTIPSKVEPFHRTYDKFVRSVIIPHVSQIMPHETRMYYQSFPCIRCVRPSEFSIGPHSDISYGFSQANINFYVPLTAIYGTNSLVLESSPGLENWHTIEARYGQVKRFYGALCTHFTPENKTNTTRVSLDFRVIVGSCWYKEHDHFTRVDGYYTSCVKTDTSTSEGLNSDSGRFQWERVDPYFVMPDYRVGFPHTFKNHEK